MKPDPIILTLQFDEATTARFEAARQAYFPAALNKIPAHLTLFHALPGSDVDKVLHAVGRAASQRSRFGVTVTGLMPLGRGVAYAIASRELMALRQSLAAEFVGELTRQDREKFRPHVTIQNKVDPAVAQQTLQSLSAAFTAFDAVAEGLQLWWYRGGPWSPLAAVAFQP